MYIHANNTCILYIFILLLMLVIVLSLMNQKMLHVMPFMDPDLEINSILFYSKYISI